MLNKPWLAFLGEDEGGPDGEAPVGAEPIEGQGREGDAD